MSSSSFNKLLYVGAACHLSPLQLFSDTKEFVFIDTKPRSEFDNSNAFVRAFYRESFAVDLMLKMFDNGFSLINITDLDNTYSKKIMSFSQRLYYICGEPKYINPHLFLFFNKKTDQTLKYYVSTNILYNMNYNLEREIGECDGLIISGFFPHVRILSYMKPDIAFIGYSSTWFGKDKDDFECDDWTNNVVNYLHDNCNGSTKNHKISAFSSFYLVDNNTIYECGDSFDTFLSKKFLIQFANKTLLHSESGIVMNSNFEKYIENLVDKRMKIMTNNII